MTLLDESPAPPDQPAGAAHDSGALHELAPLPDLPMAGPKPGSRGVAVALFVCGLGLALLLAGAAYVLAAGGSSSPLRGSRLFQLTSRWSRAESRDSTST